MKKCRICDKEFNTTNKNAKYCSSECYFASKKNGKSIKCEKCGKYFYTNRKRLRKYCSVECSKLGLAVRKKDGEFVKCPVCNKSVYRFQSQLKKGYKYCSKKCWYEYMRDGHNPMFGKKHSDITKNINREKHIGLKAWNKGKVGVQVGKRGRDNHFWKGGISKLQNQIRTLPKYKEWRRKVYERDNYTCQDCGDYAGSNLNSHHIKLLSKIVKDNNIKTMEDAKKCKELWDINNGKTLCFDCHCKYHKSLKHFLLI